MPHKNTPTAKTTFDYLIVFGEGPVKPVLLYEELTPDQKRQWERYRQDTIHNREPGFSCITQRRMLVELQKIDERQDLSLEDKSRHKEALRLAWQYSGWYALRPWGKQNALAAGYALYKGTAKKVILSGGRTISVWGKKTLPATRLENWPSEAELMRDIIRKSYGELYEKKYKRSIDEVMIIENSSTNTLENFAYTINNNPQLLHDEVSVGLLTADHHLKRVSMLADLFSVTRKEKQSAQRLLSEISEEDNPQVFTDVLSFIREKHADEIEDLTAREERWIKGLNDPQYVTYWLGYIGMVNQSVVVHNAIQRLKDPLWSEPAKEAFKKLGLNFDEFIKEDICNLSKKDPTKYNLLVQGLRKLKSPEHRTLPL
jgi:hypothetical protein